MNKTDFKKEMKAFYQPSATEFAIVEVPAMRFLMIDGEGDPRSAQSYEEAIQALYSVSYPLKFASKKQLARDYTVPPLEGLWWADDMSGFVRGDRDEWKWTMMIMVPEWIEPAMVDEAVEAAKAKKDLPALALLRHEMFDEGRAVQIMHIGPYSEEGPVLARLHDEFMPANGLTFNGHHHEIYLGDPRKTAPEKLKTVLRQPVRAA